MQRALVSLFSKIRPFEKKEREKKKWKHLFSISRNAQDNNLLRRKYCYKKKYTECRKICPPLETFSFPVAIRTRHLSSHHPWYLRCSLVSRKMRREKRMGEEKKKKKRLRGGDARKIWKEKQAGKCHACSTERCPVCVWRGVACFIPHVGRRKKTVGCMHVRCYTSCHYYHFFLSFLFDKLESKAFSEA